MTKKLYFLLLLLAAQHLNAQTLMSRFDEHLLKADTFFSGTNGVSSVRSGITTFPTDTSIWGTWQGWTISSNTDTTNYTFTNDKAAITAMGQHNSRAYAVAYSPAYLILDTARTLTGTYITNSTYSYGTMKEGNAFAKKFGGDDGTDPDSFVVRAYGWLNGSLQDSTDFYLADFTGNSAEDYLVDDWRWWDLSGLGEIDSMHFSFFSSDVGNFGINTPTYFCIDNFNGISPNAEISTVDVESYQLNNNGFDNGANGNGGFALENAFFVNTYNPQWQSWSGFSVSSLTDTQTAGFGNQYSAFAGSGALKSKQFLVANGNARIELPLTNGGHELKGLMLTNATYAALSMRDGDNFAKKFGGESGDDPDFLRLDIVGYDENGDLVDTVKFYLADYRFSDNSQDYIVQDWTWVSIQDLSGAVAIEFSLSSSDMGEFGMNTPAYFCLDQFHYGKPVDITPVQKNTTSLYLYPNPAQNILHVETEIVPPSAHYRIMNLAGQMLQNGPLSPSINIAALPAGQYLLMVEGQEFLEQKRFVKW